ncbi:hypothetical protein WG66_011811 [Moniliophthora roreri]|nr:hypothetical protein WG66_011811 [Moniliophthora roreri]
MGEASKEEAQKSRWRMPWWLVEKPDLQEPQPQSQGKTPEERVLETPPNLPMIDFKRLPSRITFRKHSKPNLDHSESASMSESQSHSDIAPDEDLTFSSELPPLSSDTSRDAIFPASACPSPNETAPSTSPTSISTHYALPPKMKRKALGHDTKLCELSWTAEAQCFLGEVACVGRSSWRKSTFRRVPGWMSEWESAKADAVLDITKSTQRIGMPEIQRTATLQSLRTVLCDRCNHEFISNTLHPPIDAESLRSPNAPTTLERAQMMNIMKAEERELERYEAEIARLYQIVSKLEKGEGSAAEKGQGTSKLVVEFASHSNGGLSLHIRRSLFISAVHARYLRHLRLAIHHRFGTNTHTLPSLLTLESRCSQPCSTLVVYLR